MGKEIIVLADIETEKHKFNYYKSSISLINVDIDNTFTSKRFLPVSKIIDTSLVI